MEAIERCHISSSMILIYIYIDFKYIRGYQSLNHLSERLFYFIPPNRTWL
uniref:Uncharacterized protein n=1 Tax=Solanum lycopersicum TaxID=4081 RepID=A0A3Q7FJQ8_SOLLC